MNGNESRTALAILAELDIMLQMVKYDLPNMVLSSLF